MSKKLRLLLSILLALVEEFLLAAYLIATLNPPDGWTWLYTQLVPDAVCYADICLEMLMWKVVVSPVKIAILVFIFILFSLVNWFILRLLFRKRK